MSDLEPPGTYKPQYRFRWRWAAGLLDRVPRLKAWLADRARRALGRLFEPGLVTNERVVEYPFVFQNLAGVTGRLLDVGCCWSRVPIALASRGFRVVGVDVNPYPFRHPNLRTVRTDAMRMPFASSTFDAALAISTVEHIGLGHYGDPAGARGDLVAMHEIARVLRPGGRLLLSVPFGLADQDDVRRVYDAAGLRELVAAFEDPRVDYARSRDGLWAPCTEADAASVDWSGPSRAVALVVARAPAPR
jgi:SAM-dependent methyltransferase